MPDRPFLIIAYDRLGPMHAGPALRSLALAEELAHTGPVDVIYEGEEPTDAHERISFLERDAGEPPSDFFSRYRAALVPPMVALVMPEVLESDIPLAVDLFDPVIWENLELYRERPVQERNFQHERHLAALLAVLFRGDYFLVAGERQRDLFLGALMALNRTNPSTWKSGDGPDQLVGLVPFGLPNDPPPSADELPLPDMYKCEGPLCVWGGGMWDWLKPETVVRAWPKVLEKFPEAHLAFPGTEHPNPHVPEMASVGKAKRIAEDLGIAKTLIFGRWLPRQEYLGLLAHAELGVSAHGPGLEARYAVRTRFLDAIWMGLPMVVSGGDEYSEYIAANGLGYVEGKSGHEAFAKGMLEVLDNGRGAYAANFSHARNELKWERQARPLTEWASAPRATHGPGAEFFTQTVGKASPRSRPADLASLINRVLGKLRSQ